MGIWFPPTTVLLIILDFFFPIVHIMYGYEM